MFEEVSVFREMATVIALIGVEASREVEATTFKDAIPAVSEETVMAASFVVTAAASFEVVAAATLFEVMVVAFFKEAVFVGLAAFKDTSSKSLSISNSISSISF